MRLVISLATRGRPEQLVDTIRKSVANWTHPNTVMQVQLDDDDKTVIKVCQENYNAGFLKPPQSTQQVLFHVKQREDTIAEKWNRALSVPGDAYLVAADDDPYVSPGYDTKILEAAERFPDGIGMVYGHLANLSFSGVVAPTAKLCELMGGKIFPEMFPYWFVDHWTDDVARIIGRISFADVRTDQSRAGKTQEMREPGWWATFFDAMYLQRRDQAHAIINHPDFAGEAWQKELLLTHHPLIEHRSRGINESVRQQSRQLEGWSGLTLKDERYQRVKQRALAMVPEILADPRMPEGERMAFAHILTPPTTIASIGRAFA